MNFLWKYRVEINIPQQCLVIHHKYQHIYVKFEKPYSARLSQKCTILPRSRVLVNVFVPGISNKDKMYLNVIHTRI